MSIFSGFKETSDHASLLLYDCSKAYLELKSSLLVILGSPKPHGQIRKRKTTIFSRNREDILGNLSEFLDHFTQKVYFAF